MTDQHTNGLRLPGANRDQAQSQQVLGGLAVDSDAGEAGNLQGSGKRGGFLGANGLHSLNASSIEGDQDATLATLATNTRGLQQTVIHEASQLSMQTSLLLPHDESLPHLPQGPAAAKFQTQQQSLGPGQEATPLKGGRAQLGEGNELDRTIDEGDVRAEVTTKRRAGGQKPIQKIEYTAEELKHMEKQAKQRAHLQELEMLTSDNCPKRHPFDFRPDELKDIKRLFQDVGGARKEGASAQFGRRAGGKVPGLPVSDLKEHLQKVMKLYVTQHEDDRQLIDSLMERLDHRNSDKITWPEFLKFLDQEGMKREEVNDAQLYGIGVKRMKEKQRKNLKTTPNQIEYYIDCCVYINCGGNFKFLLALFDNNVAKIFDVKDFTEIQALSFRSSYAQPKSLRPPSHHGAGRTADVGSRPGPQQRTKMTAAGTVDKDSKKDASQQGNSLKNKNPSTKQSTHPKMAKDHDKPAEGAAEPIHADAKIAEGSNTLPRVGNGRIAAAPSATNSAQANQKLAGKPSAQLEQPLNLVRGASASKIKVKSQLSSTKGRGGAISSSVVNQARGGADPYSGDSTTDESNPVKSTLRNSGALYRRKATLAATTSQGKLVAGSGSRRPGDSPYGGASGGETGSSASLAGYHSQPQMRKSASANPAGKARPPPGVQHGQLKLSQVSQSVTSAKLQQMEKDLDVIPEHPGAPLGASFNSKDPYRTRSSALDPNAERKRLRIQRKNQVNQMYGRKMAAKPKMKMYGVLGLDPLIEEAGTAAYFAGKDLEKDTSGYGVRFLLGTELYSGKNKAEAEFKSHVEDWRPDQLPAAKGAKKSWEEQRLGSKSVKKLEAKDPERAEQAQAYGESQSQKQLQRPRFQTNEEKMKQQQARHQRRKNVVDDMLGKTREKMDEMTNNLENLKETNKYFYGVNSPSPYMVAQQQYLKRQLEKRGVDTANPVELRQQLTQMNQNADLNARGPGKQYQSAFSEGQIQYMVKHIAGQRPSTVAGTGGPDAAGAGGLSGGSESSNHCTPEMIARYVEKLKEKRRRQGEEEPAPKPRALADHTARSRKLAQMQTKSVYTLCATFNEELALLALSLIDKEIKVYRVKQNGRQVSFVEHISFHARYTITCICIERCVANSRPILCMGSEGGEIQIYYLDEPVIDPDTERPALDGRVRAEQHPRSPINFFKPSQGRGGLAATGRASAPAAAASAPAPGGERSPDGDEAVPNASPINNEGSPTFQGTHLEPTIRDESQVQSHVSAFQARPAQNINDLLNDSLWDDVCPLPRKDQDAARAERESAKSAAQKKGGSAYKHNERTENEITHIRYVRDIGLICSTFNGTVKFFDAFNFNEQWCTTNKERKEHEHTNITVFDISVKLGLMATGGAEGKLILIDPYALGIINDVEAHSCEILQLYIFDEQQQIITVALDRSIGLWDASRLEKIEVIRDVGDMIRAPKFSSSSFDYESGQLFVGCHEITVWEAQVDQKVEINALQVQTLSKQILGERQMLDSQDPGYDREAAEKDASKRTKDTDARTGKVLVTSASTLVDIVLNQGDIKHFLITIDSENLLRGWDMEQSLTTLSYRLPVQNRVTAAAVDETNKFLAVGTNSGESKVINLRSGGVLYNLPHCNSEVTCLKFIDGMTEFWLFGACWGGKLMMWTQPTEDNNFTITARCRIGHKSDVLSLDCSQNFIVSGGVDGIVSVWNVFSGQLKYAISMPGPNQSNSPDREVSKRDKFLGDGESSSSDSPSVESRRSGVTLDGHGDCEAAEKRAGSSMKRSIVGLCFHPYYQNDICVLQEGGDIHMIDGNDGGISHKNLARAKQNSSWACDPSEMRMLVVADVGKACLYDISMGAHEEMAREAEGSKTTLSKSGARAGGGGNKKRRQPRAVAKPSSKDHGAPRQWHPVDPDLGWWVAHKIHKMEPAYVVSVKFIEVVKLFATGTTSGEVKLWENQHCNPVGTVNSVDWDPRALRPHTLHADEIARLAEMAAQGGPATQPKAGEVAIGIGIGKKNPTIQPKAAKLKKDFAILPKI